MKKIMSLLLVGFIIIGMMACGKKQEDEIDWVYVPEFPEIAGVENMDWQNVRFAGDKLYYASNSWNDQSDKYFVILHECSFLDEVSQELALKLPEEAYLIGWDVGDDGCLYVLLALWGGNEDLGLSDNTYMVAKYDAQGKELFVTDFSHLLDQDSYPDGLVLDGKNRIYVTGKSAIWLFDAEGNPAGALSLNLGAGGRITSCCKGSNGNVFASVTGYNGDSSASVLLSVDFEKKQLKEEISGFPSAVMLMQGTEGSFLVHNGTSVSIYNDKSQDTEKLFDWMDCDMDGSYVTGLGILSDGRMVAAFEDWEIDDKGIVVINKLRADRVVPKQEIVLGTLTETDQSDLVYFNRRSNDYYVTVRQYLEDYDHLEDALTRLNADILSNNSPDLLYLDPYFMEVHAMAANGVFEDLSPYLAQSSLDRNDMFENLLEEFTYDGKLICIPGTFHVSTVIGSMAKVGKEMGWTMDDVVALADDYPEASLLEWSHKDNLLLFLLDVNSFVDWENGTCRFNSDEFKSLLEYVSRFPGYEEFNHDLERSVAEKIQNGEVLLTEGTIAALDNIQYYKAMFGEDVTCIGYPNARGSSGASFSTRDHYTVMARSKVKEGAWAFIESYLTREHPASEHNWGFPNSKSELERMAEEEVNAEYVPDENGIPKVIGKEYSVSGEGGWVYHYRVPTREEVDMVLKLIQAAGGRAAPNYQLRVIIDEEVAAFFQGQKSVDEVADIIQSRASVYVSENS